MVIFLMLKRSIILSLLVFIFFSFSLFASENKSNIEFPSVILKNEKIKISGISQQNKIFINGVEVKDLNKYTVKKSGYVSIKVLREGEKPVEKKVLVIPGIMTLLPPFIAIFLAFIFKDVIVSLFLGIFTGAVILNDLSLWRGLLRTLDNYIINAIADKDRASIIVFTMMLGGMVGIINKAGGIKGIVNSLAKKIKSGETTQLYSWLLGILIFFDDYTNTLLVGNTMRPLTDKWKISREKLAYIVDSTAAPVASLAIISTWIGFEISLIGQSFKAYGINYDPYSIFLQSIPFRLYSIFTLFFVFLTFTLKREFGPMLKAEKRARTGKLLREGAMPLTDFETGILLPEKGVKERWYNGMVPILTVIVFTFAGLFYSGFLNYKGGTITVSEVLSGNIFQNLGLFISSANSFDVLLWGSFLGVLVAMIMAVSQKLLTMKKALEAWFQGLKSMMVAIVILVLAWSLGVVIVKIGTADYLVNALSTSLSYRLLPVLVFIISALISFSTGTSWGTLSIMFPLVIPLTHSMLAGSGDYKKFMILTISSILAGSVFGDHCSPISDTTIMSSMASSCDHLDHVRTQFPYAFTAATVTIFFGILPLSFGVPYLLSLFTGLLAIFLTVFFIGKNPNKVH